MRWGGEGAFPCPNPWKLNPRHVTAGRNQKGQLGRPGGTLNANVVDVGGKQPRSVHCGLDFTCAVFDDDDVLCWGAQPPREPRPHFVSLAIEGNILQISGPTFLKLKRWSPGRSLARNYPIDFLSHCPTKVAFTKTCFPCHSPEKNPAPTICRYF